MGSCGDYAISMRLKTLIPIAFLLFSLTEGPIGLDGTVFCTVCHRALVRADHYSCYKLVPEFDDKMLGAVCGIVRYAITVTCPFDGGAVEYVTDGEKT
jgi:hypothetical protein